LGNRIPTSIPKYGSPTRAEAGDASTVTAAAAKKYFFMQIPLLADFAKFPTVPPCEGFRDFSALHHLAWRCCQLATAAFRTARRAISLA
jgi:hypothetical protein